MESDALHILAEATPEEREALAQAVEYGDRCLDDMQPPEVADARAPFERGSEAWGFYILFQYKPWMSLHNGDQPLIPEVGIGSIQQCVQDKLICANCFAPGTRSHRLNLRNCSQCKKVAYCNRACQLNHWKHGGHKQECSTPSTS